MNSRPSLRPKRRRRRDAGILLAVVILLLGVVLATGAVAVWGLRGDTGSAGRDRMARQLFDCAEQGLAFGKQYFSTTGKLAWPAYYSTNVCATFGCPPFPATAPNLPLAGGYPSGPPFVQPLVMGQTAMNLQLGIYNNPGDPAGLFAESDNSAVVVARCTDVESGQTRTLQTIIGANANPNNADDYLGQAGRGFRNQGNANNQ